jgi:hypothetical protein
MGKIIGLVVVAVLLVGGYLYWSGQRDQPAMESVPAGMMATGDMVPGMAMEEKGMVSSIKEAMGLGQKMQCSYVMNQGDQSVQSTVAIDGGKYKSTTVMGEMTVYALFDGENQYTWTSGNETGMQMSKACLEKMGESMKDMTKPAETPLAAPQDMQQAFEMAKNVKCEAASAVDFALPKDITFTDQCRVMEQSMKMMQEMKDKMPANMTMPGMPAAQ